MPAGPVSFLKRFWVIVAICVFLGALVEAAQALQFYSEHRWASVLIHAFYSVPYALMGVVAIVRVVRRPTSDESTPADSPEDRRLPWWLVQHLRKFERDNLRS